MPRRPQPLDRPPDEKIVLPVRPNRILSAVPAGERQSFEGALEPVSFELGQMLHESGAPVEYVYFPESGMCSATVTMQDGGTIEVGATGNEGIVGIVAFYGVRESPAAVMVEIGGSGLAMRVADFERELEKGAALHRAVAGFARALYVQTLQLSACNRLHTVEERLARWLLMTQDRVGADRFPLTQQILAFMLGVHRPTVTLVARVLQGARLIEYQRGIVHIQDRPGLEEAACECYHVISTAFRGASARQG